MDSGMVKSANRVFDLLELFERVRRPLRPYAIGWQPQTIIGVVAPSIDRMEPEI